MSGAPEEVEEERVQVANTIHAQRPTSVDVAATDRRSTVASASTGRQHPVDQAGSGDRLRGANVARLPWRVSS